MICERHDEIVENIDDHEDRIKYLEMADTETKIELRILVCTVKDLITELREEQKRKTREFEETAKWNARFMFGGMGTAIVIFAGFVIWYIQHL